MLKDVCKRVVVVNQPDINDIVVLNYVSSSCSELGRAR